MTATGNAVEVLYCDAALLLVDKPAGLLAVPGRGEDKQDCLSSRTQSQFPDALVVHRLDMATSGLMLFARSAEMQRQLSYLFRERQVEKRYVALVQGQLAATGEINLPIAADWPNRPLRKIDHATGKHSLTRYRLLTYDPITGTSRVELQPVTGRTHQLRIHMASSGHPILGDALYGSGTNSAVRLLLHASELEFVHPQTGVALQFVSSPPF